MKLCPLFESILPSGGAVVYLSGPPSPDNYIKAAIALCNDALPREAIEAAIDCMEMYGRHYLVDPYINDHIEQLRAMLPVGE
jgi:hypothetical protein